MGRTAPLGPRISGPWGGGRGLKFQPVKSRNPSPMPATRLPSLHVPRTLALTLLVSGIAVAAAHAQVVTIPAQPAGSPAPAAEPAWMAQVAPLAQSATLAAFPDRPGLRVEVVPGALDPRLNLAPCNKVQPYLPPGHRAWGRTRIGLRCVDGPVAWNVSMPLTVKVHAPALVARQALSAGTMLAAEHLETTEVEWTATDSPVHTDAPALVGRMLARPLAAGQAVREADVRKRQWFAAGDPVKLRVSGPGFAISAEGTALSPGLEGQLVRVRTEGGRTVSGRATGERLVEVLL